MSFLWRRPRFFALLPCEANISFEDISVYLVHMPDPLIYISGQIKKKKRRLLTYIHNLFIEKAQFIRKAVFSELLSIIHIELKAFNIA